MKRKLLAMLLVLALVLVGCGGNKPKEEKPSTDENKVVETVAKGYKEDFKVKTTFDKAGKILKVEVLENKETPDIGGLAIKEIPNKIVEKQSVKVDVVSNATVTSNAILEAVKEAIKKAGFDLKNYEKGAETGKAEEPAATFKAGTYEGEATGYGGKVKVSVEVDESKIKDVKVVEQNETIYISKLAIEQLPKDIVEKQTVEVDSISGCTFSSLAVKNAVKNALEKTGVDMAAVTKKVEKEKAQKTEETMEVEVVIIGSGGAGLSAGVSSFEHGAKNVLIVEKMPFAGGNTLRAGGAMNAVNEEKQKKQGIEDSVELHFQHTFEGGHKVANEALVRVLTSKAPDTVKWLEGLGVKFKPEIGSVIGAKWARSNQTEMPLGTGFISVLQKQFEDKGGKILFKTKATEIIKEGDRVVGIKAESEEKILTIKASKGVIIATGGYASDFELAKKYLNDKGVYNTSNLPATIESTNHPGATGDGIVMAESIGAKSIDMEHIQLLPMGGDRFGPTINIDNAFFINKEGKRYVKEDGGRDELCLSAFKQKDGQYYMINDSQIITPERITLSGEKLDVLIEKGLVVEKPTLKELAEAIGVPADALEKTTEEFNKAVDAKQDEFGRKVWDKKIEKGPFYATLRYPALHHTMGGLKINEQAQVLDKEDKVIPGLFAAGEVTGGIHGANRLGGNAITDIMVFGRTAGESVMK